MFSGHADPLFEEQHLRHWSRPFSEHRPSFPEQFHSFHEQNPHFHEQNWPYHDPPLVKNQNFTNNHPNSANFDRERSSFFGHHPDLPRARPPDARHYEAFYGGQPPSPPQRPFHR